MSLLSTSPLTVIPGVTRPETRRILPVTAPVKAIAPLPTRRAPELVRFAPFLSLLLVLLTWALLAHSGWFSPEILVPPEGVATAFWSLVQDGTLWDQLSHSLYRLITGYILGTFLGLSLGITMALSPVAKAYLYPSFQLLRQLPTLALIPAFIMFLGIGETIKIVLVAKATALPIALAAFEAVRGIPRAYLDVARIYKIPPLWLILRIALPATVPPILTGMRIALGVSWMVLVATELLVSENGLGQLMEYSRQMFRLDSVLVCVVLAGVIGYVFDRGFRFLEARLIRWQHR